MREKMINDKNKYLRRHCTACNSKNRWSHSKIYLLHLKPITYNWSPVLTFSNLFYFPSQWIYIETYLKTRDTKHYISEMKSQLHVFLLGIERSPMHLFFFYNSYTSSNNHAYYVYSTLHVILWERTPTLGIVRTWS